MTYRCHEVAVRLNGARKGGIALRGKTLGEDMGYMKPESRFFKGKSALSYPAHFLKQSFEEYIRFNYDFQKAIRAIDYPFRYGEEQNQSVMFLCMNDCCGSRGAILAEQPYERKHYKYAPEKLRLDYWVLLRRKANPDWVLAIEYKHKHLYLKRKWRERDSDHFRDLQKLKDSWESDYSKLSDLKQKYILKELSSWDGQRRRIVKANLLMVPICQESRNKEWVKTIRQDDFIQLIKEVKRNLDPRPNWQAVWWLHEEHQKKDSWEDSEEREYWFNYPGVFFFARLEEHFI